MEAFLAEFTGARGAASPLHEHDGAEFVYVLTGRLVIEVGGPCGRRLDEGDVGLFRLGARRTATRQEGGAAACVAMVVVSP